MKKMDNIRLIPVKVPYRAVIGHQVVNGVDAEPNAARPLRRINRPVGLMNLAKIPAFIMRFQLQQVYQGFFI
jgi:hypothetical protein